MTYLDKLTLAGRKHALEQADWIIAEIALEADAGSDDFPADLQDVAVEICNHEGEKAEVGVAVRV